MKNKTYFLILFVIVFMVNMVPVAMASAAPSEIQSDIPIQQDDVVSMEEMQLMGLNAQRAPGDDSGRWPGTNSGNIIYNVDIFKAMQLPAAWTLRTTSEVPIGVIDSGIWNGHEDLAASYMGGATFGNVTTANNVDEQGHGTAVAGVIAGYGYNDKGSCGLCWEANIKSLKTISVDGTHSNENILAAINYADSIGIKILNISLYGYQEYDLLKIAIENFDGLIICSAGNNTINTDMVPSYPASYDCDNIISVGALDQENMPWMDEESLAGTNFGATTVDLFAYGHDVLTTARTGGYRYETGTSFAAPMVTATAALIWQAKPNLTAAQVKAAILNNVDVLSSLDGKCVTEGRLNPYKALLSVYTGTNATRKPFVRTGDINNDGKEDIVVTGATNGYLRLTTFLGNGDGTYQQAVHTFSVKVYAYSDPIFVGDVNGDGYDDVVLHWVSGGQRQLMLFPGTVTGAFGLNTDHKGFNSAIGLVYNLTTNPSQSFLRDVNSDGCADFVCCMKTNAGSQGFWVYKGIANGTGFNTTALNSAGGYPFEESTQRLFMDDVNGDGKSEVVIYRSNAGAGQLLTYSFDQSGRMYHVTETATGFPYNFNLPYTAMLGDTTGDGCADFVMMFDNSLGKRCIVQCDGTSLGTMPGFTSGTVRLRSTWDYNVDDPVYLEDVSGDGKKDVVVYWIDDIYRQMLVFKSTGTGFSEGGNYSAANRDTDAFPSDHYFTNNHTTVPGKEMVFRWAYSTTRLTYFDTFLCGTDGLFYGTRIRTYMKYFPFYVYK